MRTYAFIFVCQEGELEIESLLLAASLKRFLRCEYELIAAVPSPHELWGSPSETTRAALDSLGVRVSPIYNEIAPDYPTANKLGCLKVATSADTIVYVDSDIMCLRPFEWKDGPAASFVAKPVDIQMFSEDLAVWHLAYEVAGVPMSAKRVRTTVSGVDSPPYFNGGFFALDAGLATAMYDAWAQCRLAIRNTESLRDKWFWSEQVGLALAVQKLGIDWSVLDERFNFPAHLRDVPAHALPYFCHYHWPEVIRRQSVIRNSFMQIMSETPIADALLDVMRRNQRDEWLVIPLHYLET